MNFKLQMTSRWCSGRASASEEGGRRFDPMASGVGGCAINSWLGHRKTLKMVVMTALLGAQGCGVSITTDWLVSE